MAAVPLIFQGVDPATLNPLPGSKLYTYIGGTTTPRAVYRDSTLTTAFPNPAIADAYGIIVVWLDSTLSYKIEFRTPDDSALLLPVVDNYTPTAGNINQVIATSASSYATAAANAQAAAELAQAAAEAAQAAAESSETAAGNSASASASSAAASASSAVNAGASETNAATSETNAATSATNAATSAGMAASSATQAATSATAAASSASQANLDALSAALSEDSVNDLLELVNLVPGGPYDDVDAAVAAGGVAGNIYQKTGGNFFLIETVGPNTERQYSPLDTTQTATLSDALLASLVGLTTAADKGLYTSAEDTLDTYDQSAYIRSISNVADEAALKAAINLEPGVDVQAFDADLNSIAALATTSFGRGLLTRSDEADARGYIGAAVTPATQQGNPSYAIINGSGGKIGIAAGSIGVPANNALTDSFGFAFSSNPFVAVSSNDTSTGQGDNISGYASSTTQVTLVNGTGVTLTLSWVAVGPVA